MTEEFAYLGDRLEAQRKWHSDKAAWNRKRFYLTEMIALVAGSMIPIINVLDIPDLPVRALSASLAALIVISTGISKLYKFQENWLTYREVAEVLKREKELYLYEVGDYDVRGDQQRSKMFVERIENILATTTSQYVSLQRAEQERPQRPPSVPNLEQPMQ
jgi:uncharacterized protein DUF4231